jgi:hypothetical protein
MTKGLPPGLRAKILAEAERAPAPGSSWAQRLGVALVFLVLWVAGLAATLGLRPDWRAMPMLPFFATVGFVAVASAAVTVLAGTRGPYLLGPGVRAQRAALVALPVALLGWAALVAGDLPGRLADEPWAALRCHLMTLGMAAPLFGALAWLRRGLTQPAPRLTGALLGAAAAGWAHLMIFGHCPIGGGLHAVLGHALPALSLMGLGALVGTRLFR